MPRAQRCQTTVFAMMMQLKIQPSEESNLESNSSSESESRSRLLGSKSRRLTQSLCSRRLQHSAARRLQPAAALQQRSNLQAAAAMLLQAAATQQSYFFKKKNLVKMANILSSATSASDSARTSRSASSSGYSSAYSSGWTKRQLFSVKAAVVLELGSRLTRAGIAGEYWPRCIVPSVGFVSSEERSVYYDDCSTDAAREEMLIGLIRRLYVDTLLVPSTDRRVVLVESVFARSEFRENLARVLYRTFGVPAILFLPSHLAALMTTGSASGLLVDLGNRYVSVVPIVDKCTVKTAWQLRKCGSVATLRTELRQCLAANAFINRDRAWQALTDSLIDDDLCDDLLTRDCFATTPTRAAMLLKSEEPTPPAANASFKLDGEDAKIIGSTLERIGERIFEPDDDGVDLVESILECVVACPIDARRELLRNLLFTGGGAHLHNVVQRLEFDIARRVESDKRFRHLRAPDSNGHSVFVHVPPGKPSCLAWIGGSIMGYSDYINQRSIPRDIYLQRQPRPLPDWCSLTEPELSSPFFRELRDESAAATSAALARRTSRSGAATASRRQHASAARPQLGGGEAK